jgi:Primase C terminal 2 (PriCT-2)/Bifunctional DNA primase/polymerase, N-terminal/Family of unknown function (DUF5906)
MKEFGDYCRHGFVLCGIDRGSKSPHYGQWQTAERGITEPEIAECLDGAGLLHAYSGTCAIDIDDMDAATDWFAARGVDLQDLFLAPDAVCIVSGRDNHSKLLYTLLAPLTSHKVIHERRNIIDFRCATRAGASVQDVLPGTIHPDTGTPYVWSGEWRSIPPLPDNVYDLWSGLTESGNNREKRDENLGIYRVELESLAAILSRADPDCSREEWVRVLAMAHWESQGSAQGLALADAWSAKGKKYAGFADVETRWRSFNLDIEKPVTAASYRDQQPAQADEFEVVSEAQAATDAPPLPEGPVTKSKKSEKRDKLKALESRLVYVGMHDRYFDTAGRVLLAGDHAIRHLFTPLMPKERDELMDPVDYLKGSASKQIADNVLFHPGEGLTFSEHGVRYVNSFKPIEAELLEPTHAERGMIDWLFSRIEDEAFREWLKRFLAYAIAKPGRKIRSCPLIWSETTGNGKSTLLNTIPALLVSRQYSQEVNYAMLEEKFNGFLLNKWHINLAEFRAGSRTERAAIASKLKPWITDDRIPIREMRTDGYTMPNHVLFTATSNESDAAPIDENDRRWGVYELTAPKMTPDEVQQVCIDYLSGERARGTLLHYFANISTTGFNPDMPPPDTVSRTEMIEASMSSDEEVVRESFYDRSGPFARDCVTPQEVQEWVMKQTRYRPTAHRVGKLLRKMNGTLRNATGCRAWIMRNYNHWAMVSEKDLKAYVKGDILVDGDSLLE